MEFLHTRIHRAQVHALPTVLVVACPRCRTTYAAGLEPSVPLGPLRLGESMARTQLDRECPDHAHRFAVGA